ncbi:hypothetical protein AGR13a_Lc110268 [Agrobacterium genomosp. 13 str. CFBP 6927]|uniref:Transposase n=1 Tax=Agrobacterium genomosp. 13 str. CFBP 6927 TaxID=1183428 RepID=A0ABM9VJS4_9HYPH|nr:hypothetical protein AGR13a_Lc110268 [Agrobacterium genomosp. 13 str. CFBP 6927]
MRLKNGTFQNTLMFLPNRSNVYQACNAGRTRCSAMHDRAQATMLALQSLWTVVYRQALRLMSDRPSFRSNE